MTLIGMPSILLNAMYYMVFMGASGRDARWGNASNDQVKGRRHAVPESEANDLNRLLGGSSFD